MATTNSKGSLEERLIQPVASYWENKLRKLSLMASHGIILGEQTQKVILNGVSYDLWHHTGTRNSECSLEEGLKFFSIISGQQSQKVV